MLTECIKNFLNGARCLCVCVRVCWYETAAASERYELDARRANGRTRTCSKSTQGHTLKNRDYISNLLYRFALAHAHLIFRVCKPTKIELSVCRVYRNTANGHTLSLSLTKIEPCFIHSSVRFLFSHFSFLFLPFHYWIDSNCHCPVTIDQRSQPRNNKKTNERNKKQMWKGEDWNCVQNFYFFVFPFHLIRGIANTRHTQYLHEIFLHIPNILISHLLCHSAFNGQESVFFWLLHLIATHLLPNIVSDNRREFMTGHSHRLPPITRPSLIKRNSIQLIKKNVSIYTKQRHVATQKHWRAHTQYTIGDIFICTRRN